MLEIKKEVVKEQIVYEVSKEELEKIKRDELNKGRKEMLNYIGFCIVNFPYELNLYGVTELTSGICKFINGETVGIPNKHKYSFMGYVEHIK